MAVRADGEKCSLKGRLTIHPIRFGKQLRLTITLNSVAALGFSENRKPQTTTPWQ
jgi:hypothetical protein